MTNLTSKQIPRSHRSKQELGAGEVTENVGFPHKATLLFCPFKRERRRKLHKRMPLLNTTSRALDSGDEAVKNRVGQAHLLEGFK